MKFLILILLACIDLGIVPAQAVFQLTVGGSQNDRARVVHQTPDGGYIIAGETRSYGAGSSDVYMIKLDSTGQMLWSKTYGGQAEDYALALDMTYDKGFILGAHTGSFGQGGHDYLLIKTDSLGDTLLTRLYGGGEPDGIYSLFQSADSGYILGGHTSSFGEGAHDYYLLKTKANGDTLWTKTYGGNSGDFLRAIYPAHSGGYAIVGESRGFGEGAFDVLLVKTDSIGQRVWSHSYGGSASDFGNAISETLDGGWIIAGHTSSFGQGSTDMYLIKTNGNGKTLWAKTYGGTANEQGHAVQATPDSGYIVVGSTHSFGAGSADVYLIKTDAYGDTLWTRSFGGPLEEEGWAVQQTRDGGFIIAATTNSFGAGSQDIYIIKTDTAGNSGCHTYFTQTFLDTAISPENPVMLAVGSGTVPGHAFPAMDEVFTTEQTLCDTLTHMYEPEVSSQSIKVYPNPSSRSAVVQFDYRAGSYTFSLYAPTGQLMLEIDQIRAALFRIETHHLAEGIYFFRLRNAYEELGSGKLIIK